MIYFIQNTIDEWHSTINGYFETLDRAIEVCSKECEDWFCQKGTGEIYEVCFGLHAQPRLVWKNGVRLNDNGQDQ